MRTLKNIGFYLFIINCLALSSCEEIIMEDDISNEVVHLVAPVNNAHFFSTGVTFTWDPIEYGTQYRIQIAKPDFTNPMQIVVDTTIDTTSFTTQLNVGEYEWRVQAVNSSYSTAFSSRFLTVVSNENFESNSVTLSSPVNNLITNVGTQNLSWQSVIGATGYTVQIENSTNTIVHEQNVTGTSYSYTFPEGNFQWKVRATNGEQNTLFASRSIMVDTTVPNTPVLVSPVNLANTSDNDITFEWTRTPIAGSAETDSIYIYTNSTLTNLVYKNQETSPYNTSTLNNGTYYWFVKSFDQAGNTSQQSSVFSFTLN